MDPLATPADLANWLGRDLTAAEQRKATPMLASASTRIRSYTEQDISAVPGDVHRVMVSAPVDELLLPQLPVTAVTNVKVDGSVVDVDVDDLGIITFRAGRVVGLVEVTYSHGYTPIPDDIVGICCQVAARKMGNPAASRQQTTGPFSDTDDSQGDLTAGEMRALNRYRP